DFARSPLARVLPRFRAVDRLAVDLKPVAHLRKPFFHDHGDRSVSPWPDVEQKVPTAADSIDEDEHQLPARVVNVEIFGTVVAVTYAHTTDLFPRMIYANHS